MFCIHEIKSMSLRPDGRKERVAVAECSCGVIKNVILSSIKPGGRVHSCGCYRRKKCRETNKKTKVVSKRRNEDRRYRMFHNAKHRAKNKGLPFTISIDDIIIPEFCPLLNIPLVSTNDKTDPRNPSLDQKRPGEGYVPGNVWVVSSRANWIKSDATKEELKLIAENWDKME